jgi:vacuolar protein sorting-associated protein VTA1
MSQPTPGPSHQAYQYNPPTPQPPHQNPYAQPSAPASAPSQGPLRDDERSIAEATKHAKWAISALNFDDAATAVKELRIALRALGAN